MSRYGVGTGIGEDSSAPFLDKKIFFQFLFPVSLGLTLIVWPLFMTRLVLGCKRSVEVGMMEGLQQRSLRGREN